jgi:hypothetical protein
MQGSFALLVLNVAAGGALATARGVTAAGAYPSAGAGIRGVTRTLAVNSGDLVPIDVMGTTLVESGGAVTKDAAQMIDSTGRIVDKTSTNVVVGYALGSAAGAGTLVEMIIAGPTA